MQAKRCSKCRVFKAFNQFFRGCGRYGLHGYCKDCLNDVTTQYRKTEAGTISNRNRADAWAKANRERLAERVAEYAKRHPEARRVWSATHRAKKFSVLSTLTHAEWADILKQYDGKCAYCGKPYETIEHVVPMSQGGHNAAYNVVPACKFCNNSKHRLIAKDWQTGVPRRRGQ